MPGWEPAGSLSDSFKPRHLTTGSVCPSALLEYATGYVQLSYTNGPTALGRWKYHSDRDNFGLNPSDWLHISHSVTKTRYVPRALITT